MHMTSTDWTILIGLSAVILLIGAMTRMFFGFLCFYLMFLSIGLYIFLLAELTGDVPFNVIILLLIGIVPYGLLVWNLFYRLFRSHYDRKNKASGSSDRQASAAPGNGNAPAARTIVMTMTGGDSGRVFYDGRGYLRTFGDNYFDGEGYLRSPGDMFFDGKGYLRSPGDMFYDGKGYLRSPGDVFFDGEGYLR